MSFLTENLTFSQAGIILENNQDGGKDLYLKGICIQGDTLNANQRIYPTREITIAVKTLSKQISDGYSVLGEADHPEDLKINIDRVSHMITEMWMDGNDGYGKMKILPTPMGSIIKTFIENGVRPGVSSRGSGNVNEANGEVSDYEIITIDIVVQPSAPNAYPTAIYEGLMNFTGGMKMLGIAEDASQDARVQKYLKAEVIKLIRDLKIK